ncbi:MAG: ABC transporter ATP-binding protein [Ignavibacteriaceae bacterium]|nr:MAG: ABC transporter ATP-binding protein [Ignavibacteriaceae bacterium]MBW7873037.1 ABC transporter ATP-binding protein [Ignavibacteria bacterium]MBZ0195875.1 ABC transporter ATP-binding protein [Ignavibacteriaceae bacterium]
MNNPERPKAISIKNLVKNYDEVEAVKNISLEIEEGEMFGLVGPDGAGKTTSIRVLCGLLHPNSGSAAIFGKDTVKERRVAQHFIGYLSQKFSLYGDLSVDENIAFFAKIHKVKDFKERRDYLLEMMRLANFRKRAAEKLSGGMKQKLALACSLIHKPKLLILDEPTTGVDPVSRRDFWKIISSLNKEGMTILLTTPYLDEAERCSRIGLMNDGKIIALGEPKEVINSTDMVVLEVFTPKIRESEKVIKNNTNFEPQAFGDRLNILTKDPEEAFKIVAETLKKHGLEIIEKRVKAPSLENIFIHIVTQTTGN